MTPGSSDWSTLARWYVGLACACLVVFAGLYVPLLFSVPQEADAEPLLILAAVVVLGLSLLSLPLAALRSSPLRTHRSQTERSAAWIAFGVVAFYSLWFTFLLFQLMHSHDL